MTDAEKAAADKAAADKAAADKAAEAKTATENAAAAADAATKAERQRAADITAACQLAGKPDKAAAFISEGKSLSDVVAVLQSERAKAPAGGSEVSARHANAEAASASWDKHVERVNARVPNGRAA